MTATSWTVLAALVGLLLLAYAAALETVLQRLNVVRALRLQDEELRGAEPLLWLTEHRVTSLNVALVLATLARTGVVVAGVLVGADRNGALGVGVAAGLTVVLVLVFGEVTPRTAVLRRLEATALRLAPSARRLVVLLAPVASVIVAAGRALVPAREDISGPYASDDELRSVDSTSEESDDELEPEERAMIRSIFELADTIVREIMQPRPDMVTVSRAASFADVVTTAVEHGYSRLPVHDPDDEDAIVGVVYAKDLLARFASDEPVTGWLELIRPPTFVPETKRCDDLLRELREGTVHLAVVIDEYGEVVGLVTIEDILEEIVGEIVDEHDHEEPLVEVLEGGTMRVDARLGVDDLNELLGAELPEEGWDTVGGLVFATLGRVAKEGDRVELDGTCITVEQVQGRRVSKVLVATAEPSGETDRTANG